MMQQTIGLAWSRTKDEVKNKKAKTAIAWGGWAIFVMIDSPTGKHHYLGIHNFISAN